MRILLLGLSIIIAAFLAHLFIWKIKVPKRGMKTLIFLAFIILVLSILILSLFGKLFFLEYIQICVFVISLYLAYITTYSAIEVDSPSLVMINAIAKAGKEGLNDKSFYQMMNDDILIKPRICDLLNDRMVYLDGEKYRLTAKGIVLARLFSFYRKLLNAPKGG